MKQFRKPHLAVLVAAAMALAGCADDGKDGAPGEPGTPGEPGPGTPPPTVEMTEMTNVKVLNFAVEEGQVVYEIEVTDQDGTLVVGLDAVEGKFASWTERGYVLSRSGEGTLGGYGNLSTEGAVLEMGEPGQYTFTLPMANVTPGEEGLLWLRVGASDGPIMRSKPMVVNKPENTHSSTTAACNACHVDYATSSLKHPSYSAIDMEGEGDLVGGCLICHNSVSRADENGGYATNTLSKIAHVNHPENGFERDFSVLNCATCHETTPINTSIAGPGCVDCHNPGAAVGPISPNADPNFDIRAIHGQKIALAEIDTLRTTHKTTLSAPYWDAAVAWEGGGTGAICTDLKLFKVEGETETQLDIGALYADHTLVYASAYIHAYDSETDSLIGRPSPFNAQQYVARDDGTRAICYPSLAAADGSYGTQYSVANLVASSRLTFAQTGWVDDDGKDGVSFTNYSDVVSTDYFDGVAAPSFTKESGFERRLAVTNDSCVSCHNSETNYHKNGGYQNGGVDCLACHNNGQNRASKFSGPGFGPMVHSMHWGEGNTKLSEDGTPNSASKLNAENCVTCHADGIDLYAIPNRYMLSRAYNEGGDSKVMSSPVTANCYACHTSDSAMNHMTQNGGEINVVADPMWFTTPTAESCATCHAEGKSFGIEKFHVFER